jgi:hypothetical protein
MNGACPHEDYDRSASSPLLLRRPLLLCHNETADSRSFLPKLRQIQLQLLLYSKLWVEHYIMSLDLRQLLRNSYIPFRKHMHMTKHMVDRIQVSEEGTKCEISLATEQTARDCALIIMPIMP